MISTNLYNSGIQFEPVLAQGLSNFSTIVGIQTNINPTILLNLGYGIVESSLYAKYVVSSNPAYAYLKPWWMSTFSATLLQSTMINFNGRLLPGFCPYRTVFSQEDEYKIQTLVQSSVNESSYIYSFVWDYGLPTFGSTIGSNGIFNYSEVRTGLSDYWYTINYAEGKYSLTDNNINQSTFVIIALIVSLVFSGFMLILLLQFFIIAARFLYNKALNASNHTNNYKKIEKSENYEQKPNKKKGNNEDIIKDDIKDKIDNLDDKSIKKRPKLVQIGFIEFLSNPPSVSAFTDYAVSIIRQNYANSISEFYYYLFTVVKNGEADPVNNPEQLTMNMSELKVLYEKFCFLNHYVEKNMQDKQNLVLLKKYDFVIEESQNSISQVYLKMLIKEETGNILELDPEMIDTKIDQDSLDIFIKSHVEFTQFDTDKVDIIYFEQSYYEFCKYYALEKVIVSTSLMQNKYQIIAANVPTVQLTRNKKKKNYIMPKIMKDRYYKLPELEEFKIDRDNLTNHFNALTKSYEKMTPEVLANITVQMIIFPRWYIWDIITVILHFLILTLITIPLILLINLMETSYSPWSLKNPDFLVEQ